MGTIVEKSEYLTETKDKLKQAINNLGGDITSKTTFRNYVEELHNIYDNLPKTTGEGTNLSLTTLKGKMNIIPEGNIEQETTNGYNVLKLVATTIKTSNTQGIWNNNTYTLYGITFSLDVNSNDVVEKITISGTSTQQATFYLYNNSNYLASGSYLLSGCSNGSGTTYDLRSYNTNNTGEVKQNFTTPVSVTSNGGTQTINFALVVRSGQTISNAIIYPMLESGTTAHNWEPYTNGASPNPTYPQDIEVVTGSQEVKVTKCFETYQGGITDANGEENTSTTRIRTDFIEIGSDTSILVDSNNTDINIRDIYYYNSSKTFIRKGSQVSGFSIPQTFTNIPNNAYYYRIVFQQKTATETITPTGIYLLKFPQTQTISLSSKNLIDISKVTITNTTNWTISISGNTLSITHNNSYNTGYPTLELGKLKNGTYVLSGTLGSGIGLYKDNTYQSILNSGSTFTCNGNEDIKLIFPTASFPSGTTLTYVNMQLEKGSSATTYEEYYNYELCKIGNYQDYLYKSNDKWYKKEYILKIQLTSGLTWAVSGSGYWYYISDYQSILNKAANSDIMSNYFTKGSWGVQSENTICLGNSIGGVVGISKASFSTLEKLKTFLNNNNVYAYALLQVANDIEITNETLISQLNNLEKLMSYNGTTNISSSGNLPMIMKVRALKGE